MVDVFVHSAVAQKKLDETLAGSQEKYISLTELTGSAVECCRVGVSALISWASICFCALTSCLFLLKVNTCAK